MSASKISYKKDWEKFIFKYQLASKSTATMVCEVDPANQTIRFVVRAKNEALEITTTTLEMAIEEYNKL